MAFGGVDGDVHGVDAGAFEVGDELGLLFGVEAEVRVDGEDEPFLAGGGARGEEVLGGFCAGFDEGVVFRPEVDDAEVGVCVEPADEFFPLMEHVALELILDAVPGEDVIWLDDVAAGAVFDGV